MRSTLSHARKETEMLSRLCCGIVIGLFVIMCTLGCTREQGQIAAAVGLGLVLGVAASVPQPVATCRTVCHPGHCVSTCVSY